MKIDLSKMSLAELKQLGKRVEKAVAAFEKRRIKEARQAMEKVAKEYGLSVGDVLGEGEGKPAAGQRRKPAGRRKAAAKPKFRNPEDASQTWSGRGRRPEWYKAALRAGKSEDDLAI